HCMQLIYFILQKQLSYLGTLLPQTFWINYTEDQNDWRLSCIMELHSLGRGSFGEVMLVRSKKTNQFAALKVIDKTKRCSKKVCNHFYFLCLLLYLYFCCTILYFIINFALVWDVSYLYSMW